MAAPKPTKNPISSAKEFKTVCIAVLKKYTFRVSNKAIRHVRLTMNATIASTNRLPEAVEAIFASHADRCKRRIELQNIREWISAPGPSTEADDEAEWGTENNLSEQSLHAVRKVLDRKRLNRKTCYLVDWETTWEPREHVAQMLIAGFERVRRALVRKTYIEYEAVEDKTLNRTKG
ncbi:unnamed protein product [Phytophthora fragariaefolia]|uniref:Unnamed protein product n=1 Tax=Phytophthora fragariaefolia TaxID=1490495 RepID=A0A9W7CV26_9STRA|nr:unnamed protein product [Phytophthora fragariaefolia]